MSIGGRCDYGTMDWYCVLADGHAGAHRSGDIPALRSDREQCPVVTGQQQGVGAGLLLVCNRDLPCALHSSTARRSSQEADQ